MDISPLMSRSEEIARLTLHDDTDFATPLSQTVHRIHLVDKWGIKPGDHVLELGCGQGDCTAVLVSAVGPTGHVTAIDPGSSHYGAPFTLQQAQSHLSASSVGTRITWVNADPVEWLTNSTQEAKYDVAVLSHCIWYMSSPTIFHKTLQVLSTRAKRICIAEYSLSSSNPKATPHVLAALAQASLEAHKPSSESNIRTVLSPCTIKNIVEAVSGLTIDSEDTISPSHDLADGRWEVYVVKDKDFVDAARQHIQDERALSAVLALRDSTLAAIPNAGGLESVCTMDVWIASISCATVEN
ncbi:hypothetical protein FRB99_007446 [Tulasnella sp. 403]|nr:hypothetical protein FRB99_007446 [Tulasnella sp. 403]